MKFFRNQLITISFSNMKMIGVLIILLAGISSTRGQAQRATFTTVLMCENSYGITLLSHSDIRSVIECSLRCESHHACLSSTYNVSARVCTINAQKHAAPPLPCGNDVRYVELAQSDSSTTVSAQVTTEKPWSETMCAGGLRFDPANSSCVEDCPAGFGGTFQYQPGWYLDPWTQLMNDNPEPWSPSQCLEACLSEQAFVCKTVVYYNIVGHCFWIEATPFTAPTGSYMTDSLHDT